MTPVCHMFDLPHVYIDLYQVVNIRPHNTASCEITFLPILPAYTKLEIIIRSF